MTKYYAHSNFPIEVDDWGIARKVIKPGEEISQQKLGVGKEEWDNLVELGVVSEDEYPDIPDHMSPAEYEMREANADALQDEVTELRLPTPPTPVVPPTPAQDEKASESK